MGGVGGGMAGGGGEEEWEGGRGEGGRRGVGNGG